MCWDCFNALHLTFMGEIVCCSCAVPNAAYCDPDGGFSRDGCCASAVTSTITGVTCMQRWETPCKSQWASPVELKLHSDQS